MNQETLEKCAEAVHNAWWEEKKRQGFHSPNECPKREFEIGNKFEKHCDKCHPDMYPYAELSEHIKHYDRVTARIVLNFVFNGSGYREFLAAQMKQYDHEACELRQHFDGDTNSLDYCKIVKNEAISLGVYKARNEFDRIFGDQST